MRRALSGLALALAVATIGVPAIATAAVAPANLSVVGWGDDSFGELGDGTSTSTSTPVAAIGITDSVVQVSAGSAHTLAVTTRGEVWAWGDNSAGELGDGTTTARLRPQRVPGITNAVAVAAGNSFSLAVLANGTVKAWGHNDNGQLGVAAGPDQRQPVVIQGLSGVTAVAAGAEHSLAQRSDGTVWAWGFNGDGELGDNTETSRSTPAVVSGLSGVRQVVAQEAQSVVRLSDGSVWAWGEGSEGEMGNETEPRVQLRPGKALVANIVAIAGGDLHTLAVRSDGTVWAWGFNLDRQVVDDPEIGQPTPRQVTGLPAGITQVAAARSSSVALDSGGHAWTWGRVSGNPTVNSPAPFQVPGLAGATAIAAGNGHYQALVPSPAFSIGLSATSGTTTAGGAVTTQVSLTPANGYHGSAVLSVSGLPAGVTGSFSTGQVGVGSPATLTLQTAASTATGTFAVTVTATDPAVLSPVQTATYQLSVTAPSGKGSFTLNLTEPFGSVSPGGSATSEVDLLAGNGFTGSAVLGTNPLPAWISVSFDQAQISATSPATVTVQTAPDAPQGTWAVTITASAGGTTAEALYEITVGDPSS